MPHLYVANATSQSHVLHFEEAGAGWTRTIAPGTQQCVLCDAAPLDIDRVVDAHLPYGLTKAGDAVAPGLIYASSAIAGIPLEFTAPSLYRAAPQTDGYDEIAASLNKRA